MTMATPWMTAANSFQSQPSSFKRSVFFNGEKTILRAGWCITTRSTEKRRNKDLIDSDDQ